MRKHRKIILISFVICCCILFLHKNMAKAASSIFLTPSYVSDIDNVRYPSTSQYYTFDGLQGTGSFTVSSPTIVKAYFNWDETTAKSITGKAWFSRDEAGLDIVGSAVTLSKVGDALLVFLDPGTYYINHLFSVKNVSATSALKIGVALLAEDAHSDEKVCVSSYQEPNNLSFRTATRGFLSTTSPIDYYMFTLQDESFVNITFNFEQTDSVNVTNGICTLYDASNQKIAARSFSLNGSSENNFSYILKQGTYYIALSGTMAATTLSADVLSYAIKIDKSQTDWTRNNVKISVKTDFEPSQILCVNRYVSISRCNDSAIWSTYNEGVKILEYRTLDITKNGTYTVQIIDKFGNIRLKSFGIRNIDKSAPKISGIANKKTYTSARTIKYSDKLSKVEKATLNGVKISYGKRVSKKGRYLLKVYDYAGNVSRVSFRIR